jgi:hypothetical protein
MPKSPSPLHSLYPYFHPNEFQNYPKSRSMRLATRSFAPSKRAEQWTPGPHCGHYTNIDTIGSQRAT